MKNKRKEQPGLLAAPLLLTPLLAFSVHLVNPSTPTLSLLLGSMAAACILTPLAAVLAQRVAPNVPLRRNWRNVTEVSRNGSVFVVKERSGITRLVPTRASNQEAS